MLFQSRIRELGPWPMNGMVHWSMLGHDWGGGAGGGGGGAMPGECGLVWCGGVVRGRSWCNSSK